MFSRMPAKNVVKTFVPDSFYHVYNRGVAKQRIYLEQSDKKYFLSLFDRHLNPKSKITDKSGFAYKKFANIELNCYCLMGNHFHLLVHVASDPAELSEFMRSIGTAYTMYFNLKYKRVGPLFQGTYKASRITSDAYLLLISRYIHLNPREHATYKYSSLPVYLGAESVAWLKPAKILDLFKGDSYGRFIEDHVEYSDSLNDLKPELANY